MNPHKRIVVLVSGSGSNLQSIIDSLHLKSYRHLDGSVSTAPSEVVAVISNRPDAYALERANNAGITAKLIDHTDYASREQFDQALLQQIDEFTPDVVVLAGFMRILTAEFVTHFYGKLLNIHPSLLPKYPGLNTHQRAIDAGDSVAGVTVHFVTPELDGGPSILQARVPVLADDSAQSLAKRVLEKEHIIYPQAIAWLLDGELQLISNQAKLRNADGLPIIVE